MQCHVDHAFTLILGEAGTLTESGRSGTLRLTTFSLYVSQHQRLLSFNGESGHAEDFGPALVLYGQELHRAQLNEDGLLTLEFRSGFMLNAGALPAYEGWELTLSDGLKVICMPGGGWAVWDFAEAEEKP